MFLKRLDVVGFKSFADRISVEFVPGVTSVVGPNGSGKSNINDAIRWVLGEQSARSLRGAKMEDIIFAGSDTRKAVNLAEVTLTLDNTNQYLPIDYNEVSVTRRVYRSGDSEYLLNNQTCRLKDIIELFMDSGLGKESFSIIGQGRIEEILSSKSEERRKIFEEAAGVLKYKTRKTKAETRLKETEDNLHRVEDILYELEDQVEPLRMQASIAKDYLQKREDLEKIEAALTVHEIEEYHHAWKLKKEELDSLKAKELTLNDSITVKKEALASAREKLDKCEHHLESYQQQLLDTSEELEKLEGKKEVLKERKKNAHQNRSNLEERMTFLQEKKRYYEKEIEHHRSRFNQQKKELGQLKSSLKKETELLSDIEQDIEQELDRMKSDYFELLNEQASIRNENRYLQDQLSILSQRKDRLDGDNHKYIEERSAVDEKKAERSAKLAQSKQELEAHVSRFYKSKHDVEEKKKALGEKESKLYQAYQYIQQYKSKKEMLEEMQDDYAGFFQGVKEVLKAREDLSGIEGAVAELITVPKEVETALETALGGAMQNVVVQDEASGRQAITYLKKNRFGRATFLPLSVVKSRKISSYDLERVKQNEAFVGVASDLITFDSKYQTIMENLLGSVLVAKELKGANELAKIMQYRTRIVTLEGDVVNPGGSMSGGSVKQKSSSLLSRQRDLEVLIKKLEDMQEKTAGVEQEIKKDKVALADLEEKLDEMRERGENLRLEEQSLLGDLRAIEGDERNSNERLQLYDREKKAIEEEIETHHKRHIYLTERLETITKQAATLESKIDNLTAKKQTQQTSRESIQTEITELKVKVAEHQQSFQNQKETLDRLTTEQNETNTQLAETTEEFTLLSEAMSSNSNGEEKLDQNIVSFRSEKEKLLETLQNEREAKLSLQQEIETISTKLDSLVAEDKQLSGLMQAVEVSINRLDVELENRLAILSEEYELTYEAAKEKHVLSLEPEDARRKLKLIKLEIDELGTVNLGAIDEYDRVNERYTFLSEQQADLLQAKETLYAVIEEMDQEMKKRFEETFTKIRAQFQIVFKELFGGGKADLVLTDPDNLLSTGVDILAQPPGKKLQHLALLSGGERAFTAIALLFSILKVRPVPFCVLDEVEAALDDANVGRFAKYLKQFSEKTQFIVITHRKGTMEESDVLYGVTMQESGVSRLVSVRLEESKQLISQ
ncbi:chromosome segregation protein SMC [Pseudalkalibacillus hwajinpoensis]|uniref:chromosome segregation protein SMC n=1 Tax=Guptibacillus hwajinpoensis TaxID=208199 RepID=UPI001CD3E6AA|nr:chromosome segregation protein SMC [Pseudalkalibacillus hwajinpoensis]MCA0990199.1 chromosome segregation protein SMC [Pseudalkalibacillus hwajinpoensis]